MHFTSTFASLAAMATVAFLCCASSAATGDNENGPFYRSGVDREPIDDGEVTILPFYRGYPTPVTPRAPLASHPTPTLPNIGTVPVVPDLPFPPPTPSGNERPPIRPMNPGPVIIDSGIPYNVDPDDEVKR